MGQRIKQASVFTDKKVVSIICPVFNEEAMVAYFHKALLDSVAEQTHRYHFEIIYVDDGSKDNTFQKLSEIQLIDQQVKLIKFSRNFGKEAAITAGLNQCVGHAAIVIDCDLQDPPALIPSMLNAWQAGAEIVNMRRINRDCDSWLKRFTSTWFYKVLSFFCDFEVDNNVGDFRLLGRKAIDAVNLLQEKNRFMKGIFSWVGFEKVTIDYVRQPRKAGKTKWRYWRLWNFALDGITSFSTTPLKISSYVGFFFAFSSFITGIYYLYKTIKFGDAVHGFPTLFLTMLFLGGIQLISIGIIGEYIARLFTETKGRPLYLIEQLVPIKAEKTKALNLHNTHPLAMSDYEKYTNI